MDWIKIDLPATTRASARARRAVRESKMPHGSLREVAVLLASELVAQAVREGKPPITLKLGWGEGRLRVEVHDAAQPTSDANVDTEARGTVTSWQIVAALASRWGRVATSDGETAWFELDS